jgi:hypothetical protein
LAKNRQVHPLRRCRKCQRETEQVPEDKDRTQAEVELVEWAVQVKVQVQADSVFAQNAAPKQHMKPLCPATL